MTRTRLLAPALALALTVLAASGCVRRTLEITSEPPGARVVVNGQYAGTTPAHLNFIQNGIYLVELRADKYVPVVKLQPVPSRFYEHPGPDFIAEVLWPGVIRDARAIRFELTPTERPDREALLARARRAADEARRLIPETVKAPSPNPHAKDKKLLPGSSPQKKPEKAASPRPLPPPPPEGSEPTQRP